MSTFTWDYPASPLEDALDVVVHRSNEVNVDTTGGTWKALNTLASFAALPQSTMFDIFWRVYAGRQVSKIGECLNTEDAQSLHQLCMAQDKTYREKCREALLRLTLQNLELALLIGEAAGIPASFHYATTAKDHGIAMRAALARMYAAAVPHVYVIGGASVFSGVLPTASRFNICEGTWDAIPPMATARRLCAAAVACGCLYIIGGEYEESPSWFADSPARYYQQLDTAECFDPFEGRWRTLPTMPTARAGCAAAAVGGLVYVFGGRVGESVCARTERFDINVGRWERVPNLPTARSGCAAAALAGDLHVIGGKGPHGDILTVVERFAQRLGRWQRLPPMTTPRSACMSGVLRGKLYVVGGFDGVQGVSACECFDPETSTWEQQAPMTTWRIGAAAAVARGKLYVLGGKNGGDSSALFCEVFDPSSGSWTALPPTPERRVYCAGAAAVGSL